MAGKGQYTCRSYISIIIDFGTQGHFAWPYRRHEWRQFLASLHRYFENSATSVGSLLSPPNMTGPTYAEQSALLSSPLESKLPSIDAVERRALGHRCLLVTIIFAFSSQWHFAAITFHHERHAADEFVLGYFPDKACTRRARRQQP